MKWQSRLAISTLFLIAILPAQSATPPTDQQALHVLNRLSYGPRPGDVERVKQMGIEQYIESQLNPETIPLPPALKERLGALDVADKSTGDMLGAFSNARKRAKDGDDATKKKEREIIGSMVEQTAENRIARAIESPRQLEEVMVDFWFNHFNVFSDKGIERALIPSYERDAIRPYVFGSFRDILGATAKHPAMLFYLDNWISTSADYTPKNPGKNAAAKRGLNENYAREVMELHTLGVDGGYTQKDVTELARIFTGWTFSERDMLKNNRTFQFDPRRHDDGEKQWLGKRVSSAGQNEGEAALDYLAMRPATAHHLSYQLAQYFVQDTPPEELVTRMEKRYLETNGNIRSVLRTLFSSPEFMAPSSMGSKFKTPYQFLISAARAAEIPVTNVRPLLGALNQLGMPLYGCQTPDGYKNTEAAWLSPDALTRRITFASGFASGRMQLAKTTVEDGERMGKRQLEKQAEVTQREGGKTIMPPLDAMQLLNTLGVSVSEHTREIIKSSPENLRAALVLGSPDFMQH